MSFNTQSQKLAVSFKAQTALQTANVSADYQTIVKTNAGLAKVDYMLDSDAADIGKGSEFAQNAFPVSKSTSMTLERRLTSEWAAHLFQFGFGTANTVAVGEVTNAELYTCIQTDVNDGLDVPTFSVIEQLGTVLDRSIVGCAVNDFKISFQTGPGRNNTMTTVNLVGCGKTVEPSGITLPSVPLVEHALNGANATVVLNGTTYSGGNKSLMTMEASFNNNLRTDTGYFIGSGSDGVFAIKGRMERGNRQYGLGFTARLETGSPELTALKAQTTGTAVITIVGAAFPAPDAAFSHSLILTYPKVQYTAVDVADDNGIVVVNVTVTPFEVAGVVCEAKISTVKVPAIG
jgi:hypothetical protein